MSYTTSVERDINKLLIKEFHDGDCMCGSARGEYKGICNACGKFMCSNCQHLHGKLDTWLCWRPNKLKIIDNYDNTYTIINKDTGEESTAYI